MRKVLLIGVVAAAVGFTSCKGNYVCECKDGAVVLGTSNINDATQKDAKDACDATETTWKQAVPGAECTLTEV